MSQALPNSSMIQSLPNAAFPPQQAVTSSVPDPAAVMAVSGNGQSDLQQLTPDPQLLPSAPVEQQDQDLSDQQKMAVIESVLDEVDTQATQSTQASEQFAWQGDGLPELSAQSNATQMIAPQQAAPQRASKERIEGARTTVSPTELPGGMQYVESEPSPELSPEVAEYLQKVQENPVQLPQEIVIAAEQHAAQMPTVPLQSVKVLPITKEIEAEGSKKNTQFSIRWLVEFSRKIAAMFAGKTIYRSE